jgi:formiminotetrahydrofolate cyclodeaminase
VDSLPDRALADRPLGELLAAVADDAPAPGGGAAAAWTCALAAALVEMTAAIGAGGSERPGAGLDALRAQAAEARGCALELAERDLGAYAPVLAALRLPTGAEGRGERLRAALSDATGAPLAVAALAADVATLAGEAAHAGSPHVRGDAQTGALLAEAAARAAARLVELNLAGAPDDQRPERARATVERATAARGHALRA